MTDKRTELKELGEFKLIELLTKDFPRQHPSSVVGVGDDAAVIDAGDHYCLASTDLLVEGIHFDLTYAPLQHLGYKAVVAGISDIVAMSGVPEQIMVSATLSNRFSVEALQVFYEGIRRACAHYSVDLVGGDTAPARQGLVISVTALGRVEKSRLCRRGGMKPNDVLCVTGDLGGAYVGLQVLNREKEVLSADKEMQPDLDSYEYVLQRQLKPEARADMVHALAEMAVVPTAMIDISDGLASELFHLAQAAGLGVRVYEEKLPVDVRTDEAALDLKLNSTVCALHGGEDYELLFAISPQDVDKIARHAEVSMIGYATEADQGLQLHLQGGQAVPLTAPGWEEGGP